MKNWRLSPTVLLVIVILCCMNFIGSVTSDVAAVSAPATILYVKQGATGTCNGWDDACELRTALTEISTRPLPGEIWVAEGIYYPTDGINQNATFGLMNNVAIYGGFSGNETALEQRNWVDNVTILSGNINDTALRTDNSDQVVTANNVDATAILDGFTITEGDGIMYGAGLFVGDSSPKLSNLVIIENQANMYGGGMFAAKSNPVLENVRFSNNKSRYGYGGGLYSRDSTLALTDVAFTNNSATLAGGGFYQTTSSATSTSEATLINVAFTENIASGDGGGMYSDWYCLATLTNVTFNNNEANNGVGGGLYGAANIISASFTGNIASGDGGGLYFTTSETVKNLVLENVDFLDNEAGGKGAGLYTNNLTTTITLSDLEFAGNQAAGSGGGFYQAVGVSTLSNIVISNNTAGGHGGGMYGNGDLTDVSFTNNTAGGSGGGRYGNGNLTNVSFTTNTAGGSGGGNYGNSNLSSVSFTNNTAGGEGGGMSGSGTLADVVFVSNASLNNYGGGLYSFGQFELENVTFDQNTAKFDGGGFCAWAENNYTTSTLSGVTFSNNSTTNGDGGGMWMRLNGLGVNLTITNATFSSNSVGQYGGGLYIYDAANTNSEYAIQNVTFSGNSAVGGGAIYVGLSYKGTLGNSILWGNSPDQIAYNTVQSHVLGITNSIIQGGWADGTHIWIEDPKLAALADNGGPTKTLALMLRSPAIDKLPPDLCPKYDQRGVARPFDGDVNGTAKCDIGAFEARLSLTLQKVGSGSVATVPLQTDYADGAEVVLTATAAPGWTFVGWSGDETVTDNPLTLTMSSHKNITATFTQDEYTLSVIAIGPGEVNVSPVQATYHYDDIVTLTPNAQPGWILSSWGGDASGADNPLVVTIQGDTNITATFVKEIFKIFLPLVTRH